MPTLPSIKGSVFAGLVEDVRKLVDSGRLRRAELSRWLKPKDLECLDSPIQMHEWYDIRIYTHMSELLRDVEGKGSNSYLVRRGANNAKRLLDAGLYSQLEYTKKASFGRESDPKGRFDAFGRDLARITGISASILNFGRWQVKPDPEKKLRWIMEISQAREYPEVLIWASSGFSNELARMHNSPDLWVWSRPEPDRILFTMTRDL
jgi:hypothetical protein